MTKFSNKDLWKLFLANTFSEKQLYSQPDIVGKAWLSEYFKNHGLAPAYPGGRKFAAVLSHDVDFIYPPNTKTAITKKIIKNVLHFKFSTANKYAINAIEYLDSRNYRLDKMLEFLDKKGIRSTFFFFALNRKEEDYKYDLSEIRKEIQYLTKKEHEIALHGSKNACYVQDQIQKQKQVFLKNIGTNPLGYRNHLLNFDIVNTWKYLEKENFLYDATLGFTNNVGFRNGLAYPFNPYSEADKRFLNVFEMPLVIMDVALFKYLKYDYKRALKKSIELIEETSQQNGVISILLHPNLFKGKKFNLANELIDQIQSRGGWITTNKTLLEYWCKMGYNKQLNSLAMMLKTD